MSCPSRFQSVFVTVLSIIKNLNSNNGGLTERLEKPKSLMTKLPFINERYNFFGEKSHTFYCVIVLDLSITSV